MIQQFWVSDDRKMTICADSYDNGVLRGWFYNAACGVSSFESLSQFLLRMESILEETQTPQAYKTSFILKCYAAAKSLGLNILDDAALVSRVSDEKIAVVEGDVRNVRYVLKD